MTAPSVGAMPTTAQQSSTTPSAARTPGTRALAWAVLAAAVLEVVAPAITLNGPGSSPDAGSGPELLITPAGWAFSIWGVIYALAVAQAVGVLKVFKEEKEKEGCRTSTVVDLRGLWPGRCACARRPGWRGGDGCRIDGWQ